MDTHGLWQTGREGRNTNNSGDNRNQRTPMGAHPYAICVSLCR